jgi:Zn-finger nucleic acid-binding protein
MADRVCPVDSTELRRVERSGVQVDACPTCRGIWLDRGELDKIVERERADDEEFEREIRGRELGREPERVGHAKPRKKKRRSVLEDFLDFG